VSTPVLRPPRPELPAEVRALALLAVIDLLLGVWLRLQHAKALSTFYVTHLPVLGLAALGWGFLPKDRKERTEVWVARLLAAPGARPVLWAIGGVLLAFSAVSSSVVVIAVDPSVSTMVSVVDGEQARPDTAAVTRSPKLRLNRLTTPARLARWVWPTGRRVWLYTPTTVSFRDHRAYPWLPAKLQYPDDFVPLATVAVLPAATVLSKLATDEHRLVVLAGEGSTDTVAQSPLGEHGSLVAFFGPPPLSAGTRARWGDKLGALLPDTETVSFMVGRWEQAWLPENRVQARRPLQLGEALTWRVTSAAGVAASGEMKLTDVVTDLYLAF